MVPIRTNAHSAQQPSESDYFNVILDTLTPPPNALNT